MSLRNVRRFPVPSSREGNTGGKEGGYPCGGRFNDPETVVVPARFSLRFFEERLEMQPTLETRYCSGLFRSSGTLTAFRSQKRFSPLLKIAHGQQALFLFFLSWFRFARWGTALCSARDQSRKIKDSSSYGWRDFVFLESERRASHRSSKRNIETRTNEWGQERFENPRFLDLGLDLDFPPCHRLSLYACDLCLLGRESRTDTAPESSRGGLKTFLSYENISPVGSISSHATYSSSTHASSSTALHTVQCTLLIFFPRFVMPPHLWRIRGNEHVPPRIYATICISSRWNFLVENRDTYVFFLLFIFFFFESRFGEKDRRSDFSGWTILHDNINLSTNLSFFKRVSIRTYASTGGYVTSTFKRFFR